MAESSGYLTGVGGLRLFYRAWEVRDRRAAVLVVHGLGDHSGRYAGAARAFNDAGFATYALDLRGHGRSDGRRGHVRAFDHLLQDVDRLRRRVCSSGGECPVFLLGHSLGGLVALRYLQEYGCPSLRGAVVVAPFAGVAMAVPRWKLGLGRLADRIAPALTLHSGIRDDSQFRDAVELQRWRSDPLVHRRISARLWSEMQRNLVCLREAERPIAVPVLFQLPGRDLIVDGDAARAMSARISRAGEVREYPAAYHDLYHDPEAGHGLSDAASWLCERTTAAAA